MPVPETELAAQGPAPSTHLPWIIAAYFVREAVAMRGTLQDVIPKTATPSG
jgi:hypothetical protein